MPHSSSAAVAPPPLQLHGSFDSTDLDEIRDLASRAQHPLSVDAPERGAPLRFRLHQHPVAGIALTGATLEHEGALRILAEPLEHHYFLQIPVRGTARVTHGNRTFETAPHRVAALLSPGPETRIRSFGGFEEITLEIDASAVERVWTDLVGEPPGSRVTFVPVLRMDAEPGASIVRLTRFLVDEVSRPASALSRGAALHHLEDALIACLLQAQPHSLDGGMRPRPLAAAASLVGDAEAWMERHAAEPITMADVARAHEVSLRSLQRAFERHRSYPPRAFLRRVRLQRVHARLRHGDATTVTRVALELGFRHLSRFSGEYRSRYGETPSSTLRRARRRGRGTGARGARWIDAPGVSRVESPTRDPAPRCGFCAGDVPVGVRPLGVR